MPYAAPVAKLADFQRELIGTWINADFGVDRHGHAVGGPANPLSYNIMPLPQTADPDGYILKNFKYHERIRFNGDDPDHTLAVTTIAPNRGGDVTQNARALFYEQQVRFAEGPAQNKVVHVENGTWLWLPRFVQQPGPYPPNPDAEPVSDALQQPYDIMIGKQISIPHGNSVLALGSYETVSSEGGSGVCEKNPTIMGSPVIPDGPSPYPMPTTPIHNPAPPPPTLISILNVDQRYSTQLDPPGDFQNPHPHLTQCPNRPLQQAVAIIKPDAYMHWHVTTARLRNGKGSVTNIPFEQRVSDVTQYSAEYWLLFKEADGKRSKYLVYTQTILMILMINGSPYVFPHITCNTVTHQ